MIILGITGFAGSGKDTAANILIEDYGFAKISFAAPLKDMVSSVFRWDRELVEGGTDESRAWRETIDPWWANRLSMPHLTPRWVLQYMGTEVMRNHFHDSIWIASIEKYLQDCTYDRVVITDARFPNEFNVIRQKGGRVGQVNRKAATPNWYNQHLWNGQPIPDEVHPSEKAWVGEKKDFYIDNNGNLENLREQVAQFMEKK